MFRRHVCLATSDAPVYPTEVISGRELDRRLKRANSAQRVLIAGDLVGGRLRLDHLTELQARCLTGVGYFLRTVSRLSESERAEIEAGRIALSDLHHRGNHHPPSDSAIADIVRLAPERVLAALDHATQPATNGNGRTHGRQSRSPLHATAAE